MSVREKISGENFGWAVLNRKYAGGEADAVVIDGETGDLSIEKAMTLKGAATLKDAVSFGGLQSKTAAADAIADPGDTKAIPVTASGCVAITTGAGAETNTLAIPTFLGQTLDLFLDTAGGGTRTVTAASGINQAGNTHMAFTQSRDYIRLVSISVAGTLAWQVAANDGVTLS